MGIATTPAIERVARVLAGWHASINADGMQSSPAVDVDAAWRDYRDDANAVLKTLREPDAAMAAAGDAAIRSRMIAAAIAP